VVRQDHEKRQYGANEIIRAHRAHMRQMVRIDGDWGGASCPDVFYTFDHLGHCLIGKENTLKGI
jgi:hypothetical protein